jgi:hypothetical protein
MVNEFKSFGAVRLRPIKEVMDRNLRFVIDWWADSATVCRHNNIQESSMVQKRAHVFIPEGLLAEIDKLVGKGKRSSLITEILDHEIRRRRLLQILEGDQPIWKE